MRFGDQPNTVSILGTGDLARALAKKFAIHGYSVACGSRSPMNRSFVARDTSFAELDVKIMTSEECIKYSDLILLAIHPEHMKGLMNYKNLMEGKILVDVSNVDKRSVASNAQSLAEVFGNGNVVKAFNTISAYELEHEETSDRKVYICGDNAQANDKVEALAKNAGFGVVRYGGLSNALEVEESQRSLWQGWGTPVVISTGSFVLWGVYGTMRYQVWKGNAWSMWPLNTVNKVFGCTSLSMLAICYLPGCIAAGLQLVRGTKHIPFPGWLDKWLKMRKQLGLISLFMAGTHCVISLAHMSAPYFPNWYQTLKVTIPAGHLSDIVVPIDSKMNWKGETVLCLGGLALGTMTILGLTSIPSVGSAMNWRQWNFVHTKMGYTCLALASTHVLLKGAPDWVGRTLPDIAKGMAFLSLVLPAITLTSKTLLSLPFISGHLAAIRRGYERGRSSKDQ